MSPRLPALDAARGLAVIAMVLYHFSWDLALFGLIETDVAQDGRGLAMAIAGSFLAISGVALTLAGRIRPRRLAILLGAATLVSAGSWWFDPGSFIFFGILHCIALSSLLAWPLLRAPAWLLAAAAALIFAAALWSHPAFDAWPWLWLGLSTQVPLTNDYIPIIPWFGFVLLGMLAGRLQPGAWAQWGPGPLVWLGRHSLLIYLVHQPVLTTLLFWLAPLLAGKPG